MKQYIDKAAIVAEIEKRIKKYATINVGNSSKLDALYGAKCKALMEILSFLDTLEVKDIVAEQEGICNGILNTITGDTWHIKIPLNKAGLKHGDKVKIFITKEK